MYYTYAAWHIITREYYWQLVLCCCSTSSYLISPVMKLVWATGDHTVTVSYQLMQPLAVRRVLDAMVVES